MRIPIAEGNWLGGERSFINAIVDIKGIRFPTTFLLDTGSPYTIISEDQLKRTRIPFTSYPVSSSLTIAQVFLNIIDFGECDLSFLDDAGNTIKLKHRTYGGILANRKLQLTTPFPSFLGKDFVDKFNFAYSKKDDKGIRYLE